MATRESLRGTDYVRVAIPIAVTIALVISAWRFGYFHLKNPQALNAAAERAVNVPWLGPIFVVVYAFLAALAAPVSPLAYGAGAVFGLLRGSIYVWIGSMLGGTAGYWLARGVWSEPAHRLLGSHRDKLQELRRGNGFLTTMRLQLLPIVPFGIFNYAAGTTEISFVQFLAGTALGIIPGTIAAVYVGDRLAAGFQGSGKSAFLVAGAVMAGLIALSFAPTAIRKLRGR